MNEVTVCSKLTAHNAESCFILCILKSLGLKVHICTGIHIEVECVWVLGISSHNAINENNNNKAAFTRRHLHPKSFPNRCVSIFAGMLSSNAYRTGPLDNQAHHQGHLIFNAMFPPSQASSGIHDISVHIELHICAEVPHTRGLM